MSTLPLMTVSGIRGVIDETLTEDFCSKMAFVHAKVTGARRMVVGRDTRPSGERLGRAIVRGLRAAGVEPIDIGIAPTPTTGLATAVFEADAGVIVSASHNPIQYNGYKMVHRSGRLCNDAETAAVYRAFAEDRFPYPDIVHRGERGPARAVDAVGVHIERIVSAVDAGLIRKAGIRVAIDSTNGAAGVMFPRLLDKLGVQWVGVHNKLDGDFVHNPEPRPEHLGDLSALLAATPGLWAGFAFDPDADRLAPMGESGQPISEEMTLALALDNLLSRRASPVVTNLSTSMVVDDVARSRGVAVVRTKIGEANVVEGMLAHGSLAGGEGNGGVIYPAVVTVRDGLTALALIIELMAKKRLKITSLVGEWPRYVIVKEKIPLSAGMDPAKVLSRLGTVFSGETLDRQDGLKIIRKSGWVHLRASNTEPIMRCIAEAATESESRALIEAVLKAVGQ